MPTPSRARERRLLQWIVTALGLVPILAGAAGVLRGHSAFDPGSAPSLDCDSHAHYLSGLLLAIGLGFWSSVPDIDKRGDRFRLLTGLVLIGGFARLYGLARNGTPGLAMQAALIMELLVVPGLALWRERLDAGREPGRTRCSIGPWTGPTKA
jgi:hypothetical protein